jgi:hypothetical protein
MFIIASWRSHRHDELHPKFNLVDQKEKIMNRPSTLTLTMISALLFGFALNIGDARAQQKPLKEQLVGTWILVSDDNVAPNGTKRQIFGPNPKGIAIFDANGRYAQILMNPNRPKFKGSTRLDGTPEENKAVVQATAAHFGTWSINEADRSLTVHQEINIFPNDDGLVSKRSITLAGDELKVTNPNPSSGGTAELVWRRAK